MVLHFAQDVPELLPEGGHVAVVVEVVLSHQVLRVIRVLRVIMGYKDKGFKVL